MQKKIFLNGYTQNQKKMNSNIYLILLIINFSCSSQTDNNNQIVIPQNNEKVEIYLIDNLDDSRGYCLDMKGYKENADTVDIKWGDLSGTDFNTATMNTNADQYVGKTLAYGMASSGSNQSIIAEKSYNNSSSIDSSPVPLEVFIADGEGFSITTTNLAPITIIRGYNFIVIPETN